jgi:hypothetical protein
MQGDQKGTDERWKKLEGMVKEAFPEKEIEVLKKTIIETIENGDAKEIEKRCCIRISEKGKPWRKIGLFPSEELMTDEDNSFIELFEDAIKQANRLFGEGKKGFLGTLRITSNGSEFVLPGEHDHF